MITAESFLTESLSQHPYGNSIRLILNEAIKVVQPGPAVEKFIRRNGNYLWIDGKRYLLTEGRVAILSLGKAAHSMTAPLVELLSDLKPRGLIIPKFAEETNNKSFVVQPGAHPIPDKNSILAGEKAINLLKDLKKDDLLICLISGGGSSLMMAPHDGITFADLRLLNSLLLACGAQIQEINTIRRHLDKLKGGGVARIAFPAQIVSLILSDVAGDSLEDIASGPTTPDPTSIEEALLVLEKYGLTGQVPPSILTALKDNTETPKPADKVFGNVTNTIIGNNKTSVEGAINQARREGFNAQSLGSGWEGEARITAHELFKIFQKSKMERPFCLVGGGETTVIIKGKGLGGRNQELALAMVRELSTQNNSMLITLATDGEDGPTDAAGAVVTNETYKRSIEKGMDAARFLDDNDSHTFFSELGDLLKPGPSGTNVNDLYLLFGF